MEEREREEKNEFFGTRRRNMWGVGNLGHQQSFSRTHTKTYITHTPFRGGRRALLPPANVTVVTGPLLRRPRFSSTPAPYSPIRGTRVAESGVHTAAVAGRSVHNISIGPRAYTTSRDGGLRVCILCTSVYTNVSCAMYNMFCLLHCCYYVIYVWIHTHTNRHIPPRHILIHRIIFAHTHIFTTRCIHRYTRQTPPHGLHVQSLTHTNAHPALAHTQTLFPPSHTKARDRRHLLLTNTCVLYATSFRKNRTFSGHLDRSSSILFSVGSGRTNDEWWTHECKEIRI